MATLTLGLIVHGVLSQPYAQTKAATAGPDVVASNIGLSGPAGWRRFVALADARGVTAHRGPYPVAWPVLRAHGMTADVMAEGRDQAGGPGRPARRRPGQLGPPRWDPGVLTGVLLQRVQRPGRPPAILRHRADLAHPGGRAQPGRTG